MFLGEYIHTLDSKGRLTIPAKYRDRLVPGLVVTRNPLDPCLLVMPLDEWERRTQRLNEMPITSREVLMLRRLLFTAAEDLKPDRQGRILISQRLRDIAGIENDVLIAGMNTYLELWDPQRWEEKVLQPMAEGHLVGDLFAALGV